MTMGLSYSTEKELVTVVSDGSFGLGEIRATFSRIRSECEPASRVRILIVDQASDFDPVLYLQQGCVGSQVSEPSCADDNPARRDRGAQLVAGDLSPGEYLLFVDAGTRNDGSGGAGRFVVETAVRAIAGAGAPCDPYRLASRCGETRCLLEDTDWLCR